MLSPQDKKEIQGLIAQSLSDFKKQNVNFRAIKNADQSKDVKQVATVADIKGFFPIPVPPPTITGSKGGNVALANLLTALASLGLIINSTT